MEGKIKGNTHNQNGVSVQTHDGENVAVIEGAERIFSVEDTAEMEKLSGAIGKAPEEEGNLLAMELGYKVSKMIAGQDTRGSAEEEQEDDDILAIIEGTDEPDDTVDEFIT